MRDYEPQTFLDYQRSRVQRGKAAAHPPCGRIPVAPRRTTLARPPEPAGQPPAGLTPIKFPACLEARAGLSAPEHANSIRGGAEYRGARNGPGVPVILDILAVAGIVSLMVAVLVTAWRLM